MSYLLKASRYIFCQIISFKIVADLFFYLKKIYYIYIIQYCTLNYKKDEKMTNLSPIKIAKDVLCLTTAKDVRDYVAIHGYEIWQLPTSSLLNVHLLCLVEIVDTGGNLNVCLNKIRECIIISN